MPRDDAKGPYVRWVDGYSEGWHPQSFDTLQEAVTEQTTIMGSPYVITRVVEFVVMEKP